MRLPGAALQRPSIVDNDGEFVDLSNQHAGHHRVRTRIDSVGLRLIFIAVVNHRRRPLRIFVREQCGAHDNGKRARSDLLSGQRGTWGYQR